MSGLRAAGTGNIVTANTENNTTLQFAGGLADLVEEPDIFPYTDIPHFPVSTVAGHKGR